ncbi:Uncharacterized protein Adt_02513 [Abeliophyllum distichum]|uniref:Retrotransposon Copia-like N-terminal domain-containing protein n=1 Tax=Abeliophyllum distichum TaxID=126358 RepID=A0ABD1VZ56_9LAMI
MADTTKINEEIDLTKTVDLAPQAAVQPLVQLNSATQISLKLTSSNYFSWKAQFTSLLYGLNLLSYVDGTFLCPSETIPNLAALSWKCQDQLILHDILSSLSESIIPLVFFLYHQFNSLESAPSILYEKIQVTHHPLEG